MAFKFIAILSVICAVANAGLIEYAAPAALTSQSANILRSPGNLAQISTYSKTIDTPYSSVSKSDVRVSNPGIYTSLSYAPYAAPAIGYAHAPLYAKAAVPVAAAPVVEHAPIITAHTTFSGLGTHYAF